MLRAIDLGCRDGLAVACAASLVASPEMAVILEQVILGVLVAVSVLLLLPFLLVMAGVGAAMLLWFAACGALLGGLVFWLVFPSTYALAVLLFVLVIGLVVVDRRSRNRAS